MHIRIIPGCRDEIGGPVIVLKQCAVSGHIAIGIEMPMIGKVSIRGITRRHSRCCIQIIFAVFIVCPQYKFSGLFIVEHLGPLQIHFSSVIPLQLQSGSHTVCPHGGIHGQNVISEFPVRKVGGPIAADIIPIPPVFSIPVVSIPVLKDPAPVGMDRLPADVRPQRSVFHGFISSFPCQAFQSGKRSLNVP